MSGNKTEQPTPKRLQDVRKKGQVFKSSDLTQAVLLLTGAGLLALSGSGFMDKLQAFARESFDVRTFENVISPAALLERTGDNFLRFLVLSAPLLIALFLASIAMNLFQVGFLFASEPVRPKFELLNPAQGFQNLFFKSKTYVELAKTIIKFTVILWLVYSTYRYELRDVVVSARLGVLDVAVLASRIIWGLLFKVGAVLLLIGGADYFIQKHLYLNNLKMTKQDVTKEYKEQEGDPHLKGERKRLHRLALAQAAVEIPRARAVIVNPTHLAVAIRYDDAYMNAPEVSLKGQDTLATEIIRLAKRHFVPVVRNVTLARSLYTLDVETEIPEHLYAAVAEILNWAETAAQQRSDQA